MTLNLFYCHFRLEQSDAVDNFEMWLKPRKALVRANHIYIIAEILIYIIEEMLIYIIAQILIYIIAQIIDT